MKRGCGALLAGIWAVFFSASVRADKPAQASANAVSARPEEKDSTDSDPSKSEPPPRTYVSVGFGGSTGSQGAIICAEVAPLSFLSVSGCGNGSGFLHHDDAPDLSHFRLNVTPISLKAQFLWLQPRFQLGFAEMQVGADTPGFQFAGTNESRTSTSGLDAGASLRAVWPLGKGFELLSEFGLGLGYFHHAPQLIKPQSAWIPSASLVIGAGF